MKTVFLLVLLVFDSGCKKRQEILKLGTNFWTGYQFLYLAEEKGFIDRNEILLCEYPSTTRVLSAFRRGQIDAAALTLDEAISLYNENYDIAVVLILDFSNGADGIVAHASIPTINNLKGMRIGGENTALGAFVIARALEIANLKPEDVSLVHLEYDEQEHAFLNNRIDALVTFDPVMNTLLKKGGHIIFDSSEIPAEILDVLIVRKSYLYRNPDLIDKLGRSWFKAMDYAKANRDESYRIMMKREDVSEFQFMSSMQKLNFPGLQENSLLLEGKSPPINNLAENVLKIMISNRLIKNNSDISGLINSEMITRLRNEISH